MQPVYSTAVRKLTDTSCVCQHAQVVAFVVVLNLLLLVSATPQTKSNPESQKGASDDNKGYTNSIIVGQHTTEQLINRHVAYDVPILTPPPRLTQKEVIKPLRRYSAVLIDKSKSPTEVGKGFGNGISGTITNENVEPRIDLHNEQSVAPVSINEPIMTQDLHTSQSTSTGVFPEDPVHHSPAKGRANRIGVMKVTKNSGLRNTTQAEFNANEQELDDEFKEFQEAMAKDPLNPCSRTANQELLNSTIIYRSHSDKTGDGYEFMYFAPEQSFRHEIGVVKNAASGNPVLEVRGYYIWYIYKPESLYPLRYTYVTHYVANENGYQVEGEHIPGSQGKVPNKVPIEMVPCSDEDDRVGAPGLLLQEALLGGGG